MTYFVNRLYPIESKFKYPKAGEENAIVSVHIYDLKSKKTSKVDLGVEKDQYVPRIFWAPDGELCIFKLNRHQNKLIILKSDSKGKTKKMLSEENKYFIDINDYLIFTDSDKFLWLSDQDGFTHIYLHNLCGEKIKQLTQGDWDITKFYGYDNVRKVFYYQAAAESPLRREVYFISVDEKKKGKISKLQGTNDLVFSKNFN
jgi:dipeptidyl-peptidase-4